ncbi:MAG: DnaJ domain-containing protein, partial [Deltaproteobacteria bacterium]|nr:DnaJ domain-containing protein [Deltaproteobacteria bacterium]
MKVYSRQNHYELLEVSPGASLEEITQAYQQALEAFNEDSVAIYSLFDEDELQELLRRIQAAYRTLSTGRTRREYDRHLLGEEDLRGEGAALEEEEREEEAREDQEAIEAEGEFAQDESLSEPIPLAPLVKSEGEPLTISPGQTLRGDDLKNLRESRGVSLEEVACRTRIGMEHLRAIEL